ncbi:hypothetical protein AB4Z09_07755 [Rhodococcus sp. TAF43]|uniref:hypothetical protein n=1 Tax=unclassified Rhodococcus (in: high G+C Gram-positive bacteria) TaxID=192944 RepID=UPI0015824F8B|nr:hypothetical protein [Rhodococcus sp. W8901]QKT11573.1 hypothetical protein HUN07_13240 [Rhodococcus sp. W8901]
MGGDQPVSPQESWYWHHIRMSIADLMVDRDQTVDPSDAYTWIEDKSIRQALDTLRRGNSGEWPAPVDVAKAAIAVEYPPPTPYEWVIAANA